MAFSKIVITFVEDCLLTNIITFYYRTSPSDTGTPITYKCALSITQDREFVLPTPTANVGEATAIEFEASFNTFDVPLGLFTISRVLNEVTITATNITTDFVTAFSSPPTRITSVITNNDTGGAGAYNQKINVRSPFFISTPTNGGTIEPTSSDLSLFIWTGDKVADKPVTATYTLNAEATNFGDDNIYFEVAELIRDFITHSFSNDYPSEAAWVYYEITSTYDSGTVTDEGTFLAVDGYTMFQDNVNYTGEIVNGFPEDSVLITNREIYVDKTDVLRIPVYTNSTSVVGYYLDGVPTQTDNYVISDNTNGVITYSSYDIQATGDINEVRVTNTNTGTTTSIDVVLVDECKYEVNKVTFLNKSGIYQDLWMFKANRETINVKKEMYRANLINSTSGSLSYNTTEHQYKNFLVKTNKSVQLNSGYLSEDNNAIFEELLASERVFITSNGTTKPVKVMSSSLSLKTRINDKLIAYTIDFDYAYDEINNVR